MLHDEAGVPSRVYDRLKDSVSSRLCEASFLKKKKGTPRSSGFTCNTERQCNLSRNDLEKCKCFVEQLCTIK